MDKANSNLVNKSKKGFIWDLGGNLINQSSSLIVSIVLARILSPEEFGIVGMALAFIVISQVFVDVGFTDGIIQQKEVSNVVYSSIFFVNITISCVIALMIFFSASSIGNFYENAQVEKVVKLLVLILPISALGKVHSARLIKFLRIKALATRNIIGTIAGGIVGIVMAVNNYGVFSLVGQQLAANTIRTVLYWQGTNWRPSFEFSRTEVSYILSFSSFVFLDQISKRIFQKIDTLFIGKFFSPAILGYYTRAESLNSQIMTYTSASFRKIMLPVFSILQDDDERFKLTYFKVFSIIAVMSSTAAGILFILSDKIILGLFGDKWEPSVIIFQILVFRTVIAPYSALMSRSLLSKGYSKVKFYIGLVQRLIMLIPIPIGIYYGIIGFTIAVVIATFIYFIIFIIAVKGYLNLDPFKQFRLFAIPLIPLMITIAANKILFQEISNWWLAIIFVLFQFVFLSITKDEGFKLLKRESINLIKLIKVKLAK